jgi:alkaline phosphatase
LFLEEVFVLVRSFYKKATVFAVLLCFLSSVCVAVASPASQITILPIDKAKFLAGQKFDFEVEVKDADAATVKVTINGKSAEEFFGKTATRNMNGALATYRIDQITLSKAGEVEIAVAANTGDGAISRTVHYNVVNTVVPKKAKNVILFIGDGMSLQMREAARILSKGITEGKYNDLLDMEKMSNTALITTSGYDSLVTDSANSASAYATGQKGVVNAKIGRAHV